MCNKNKDKMIKEITNFLKGKPSYLKKGDKFLADKFGCSERTIRTIKGRLSDTKKQYLESL